MTIRIDGTLLIKKIASRNGPFNTGELITEIGEFKVKDPIIDQFGEGKFQGTFWISQIFPASYLAFGKVIIEIRAKLADAQINNEGVLPRDVGKVQEPDPADEDMSVKPITRTQPKAAPRQDPAPRLPTEAVKASRDKVAAPASKSKPVPGNDEDLALFGEELFSQVQSRTAIKLDPTIDRIQFRLQIKRLGVLGYKFASNNQTWSFSEAVE